MAISKACALIMFEKGKTSLLIFYDKIKTMRPKCILFAGPVGCSKTPVAYYLSWNLGLPIFNNDTIRTEVAEDKLEYIPQDPEYLRRKDERVKELLAMKRSFISDASIDRDWKSVIQTLDEHGFDYFIISYNLPKEKLIKMDKAKNYGNNEGLINKWHADHEKFLAESGSIVGLNIDDNNFGNRLQQSLKVVKAFLED